jgi:hypothetical protein
VRIGRIQKFSSSGDVFAVFWRAGKGSWKVVYPFDIAVGKK